MSNFSDLFRARGYGLVLPREHDDDINRYVAMHSGERQSVERRPFPRQVDFWAFCIATALALNLRPREESIARWGKTFINTSQGIMDDQLCSLLAIIAVAKLGHDDPDVTEIRRIVELANRLAAAGCSVVLNKLSENILRTTPLDQTLGLARSLRERIGGID
ncbi:MAG: hypothetical protein OXU81_14750 [Gammaproteobacteria bacterium]|nr:hypothetical protein [Gammaproteobacteria bacterium]